MTYLINLLILFFGDIRSCGSGTAHFFCQGIRHMLVPPLLGLPDTLPNASAHQIPPAGILLSVCYHFTHANDQKIDHCPNKRPGGIGDQVINVRSSFIKEQL